MTAPRTVFAALIAALAWPHAAAAGELFSVELQSIAPVVYETPEPITTQVNAGAVELTVPVKLREGTYLTPGFSYRLEAPRFINPPPDALPVPFLHELDVSLALHQQFGAGWAVTTRLNGGLAGDLYGIDRGVVRLGGLALLARSPSDRLTLGGGVAATWAFGQLLPVPLLRVRWQPGDALLLDALVPSYITLTYTRWERVRGGVFTELVGNEYAARHPDIAEVAPCAGPDADAAECLDHIAYTDGNLGLLLGARPAGDLWIELRGGVSVYRRFEMLNADDAPITGGDQRLPPAAFAAVKVGWAY
ncbi:MAG: hypothetical protein H6739_23575 [Alphaproteobacteria bacterium]|nr:hypothetical protein [Alphaproteobacteria bacterium]